MAGLYARHQGRQVEADSPALEAKILDHTRRGPKDGSTHWSTRKLAEALEISHMRVARTWAKAGLQPHWMRLYMACAWRIDNSYVQRMRLAVLLLGRTSRKVLR